MNNYQISFIVNQSPEAVFLAIKNVKGWWTGRPGVNGTSDKLNDEFTYKYNDIHFSKQKVTVIIPNEKIVWHVTEANLSFVKDKSEWKDTDIVFEISKKDNKTEVKFSHQGLVPQFECYDNCSNAWNLLIKNNLNNLIVTGKDQPLAF